LSIVITLGEMFFKDGTLNLPQFKSLVKQVLLDQVENKFCIDFTDSYMKHNL